MCDWLTRMLSVYSGICHRIYPTFSSSKWNKCMLICLHICLFVHLSHMAPPVPLLGVLMKLRPDTSHIEISPPPHAVIGMLMNVKIASQRWNFNKHPFKARRFTLYCMPIFFVCVRVCLFVFPPIFFSPLPAAALFYVSSTLPIVFSPISGKLLLDLRPSQLLKVSMQDLQRCRNSSAEF